MIIIIIKKKSLTNKTAHHEKANTHEKKKRKEKNLEEKWTKLAKKKGILMSIKEPSSKLAIKNCHESTMKRKLRKKNLSQLNSC
jgi:hypothetical protein